MLPSVPTPPSDPIANELHAVRASLEALTARVEQLATENQRLHQQLELSQQARSDLVSQCEHLISMLADSRKELRAAKGEANG